MNFSEKVVYLLHERFLLQVTLLLLYLSYIHSYINHANLAWAGKHKTNLKNSLALRTVYNRIDTIIRKNFSDPATY